MPNQKRKYLAFDIETAAEVPGDDFDWRRYRPLGITCVATLADDAQQPKLWHGRTADDQPADRMRREEVQQLVAYLADMAGQGYTVLSWNGLSFDFDILAEESGQLDACRQLALAHVDMMWHVFCVRGHPVALNKAAEGMGIAGKPEGMSGLLAPRLWAEGQHQQVLEYVAQDVRVAMELARTCEQRRTFQWVTRKGTRSRMPLDDGWLTVAEALDLSEPDTSWMSNPPSRRQFTAWLS